MLQQQTTSTEFIEWLRFLDIHDTSGFHRQDHFFAQLTAEVRRSWVKNPGRVDGADFLLDFKRGDTKQPLSQEEQMKNTKSFFFAALGMTEELKELHNGN